MTEDSPSGVDPHIPPRDLDRLKAMSRIGHPVTFRHKGAPGSQVMGIVEAEVFIMVSDYKHLIQRIRFAEGVSWDGSTYAYRTGYYTYDGSGRHIKWGQYTQFLTEREYQQLLGKARALGWPL